MTEQELREKIVKKLNIIQDYGYVCRIDGTSGTCHNVSNESVADALIAAEIGDVTEWKDKATAAELVAQAAANAAIERIEEWKHRAKVAERALYRACGSSQMMLVFLQKAEKELQEEKER